MKVWPVQSPGGLDALTLSSNRASVKFLQLYDVIVLLFVLIY